MTALPWQQIHDAVLVDDADDECPTCRGEGCALVWDAEVGAWDLDIERACPDCRTGWCEVCRGALDPDGFCCGCASYGGRRPW